MLPRLSTFVMMLNSSRALLLFQLPHQQFFQATGTGTCSCFPAPLRPTSRRISGTTSASSVTSSNAFWSRRQQQRTRTFHHLPTQLASTSSPNPEITVQAPFYKPRDNNNNNNKSRNDKKCWRPTVSDVERISWGLPAAKKGTGSRGVPHRLNADERKLFDMARRPSTGFLQVTGSAWRSQRRDAPLLNTYRSLCDARAQVAIVLHKGTSTQAGMTSSDMVLDKVVLDLSPLRLSKASLEHVATKVLEEGYDEHKGGGRILGVELVETDDNVNVPAAAEAFVESLEAIGPLQRNDYDDVQEEGEDDDTLQIDATSEAVMTKPIYQLASYCVQWELPRPDAKSLAKKLATVFGTPEGKSDAVAGVGTSKKPGGVKPGKSRRSGGYGIG